MRVLLCLAFLSMMVPRSGPPAKAPLFADEFNGTSLDRTRWNVVITGRTVNDELQAYIDSPEVLSVAGGMLTIRPRFREGFKTPEGRAHDFVSGRIDTKARFAFTYGTASARMKLAAGPGLWPAFWALGDGRWPDTGEIDIMENVGDPGWTSVALHGPGYFGDTPLVKRAPFSGRRNATDWHVYAVDWTPDALVFAVDGRSVYTVNRPDVERYGRWAFDNPKYLILNLAIGGTYPAAVNHAGAPYGGLAPETAAAIKAAEPRILVDWVRVTGR